MRNERESKQPNHSFIGSFIQAIDFIITTAMEFIVTPVFEIDEPISEEKKLIKKGK